jgi:hypothetical protein
MLVGPYLPIMESSNTVTKDSSNSLTVSIFLEICILQRKRGKTWNDVSEHIKDVYKMTINPLKIHKLQKVLQEKLSKMSKNKLKSELQNLKQDNLINYISLQGGKGKRNENYIQGPSHSNVRTANHLQEAEFRNQVMKNQNKILKEIVTEQSQNIWKLKTTISLAALFVVYVFSEDLLSFCKHLLCVLKHNSMFYPFFAVNCIFRGK